MKGFGTIPFLRVLIPFCAGIGVALIWLPDKVQVFILCICLAVIVLAAALSWWLNRFRPWQKPAGLLLLIAFFLCGILLTSVSTDSHANRFFAGSQLKQYQFLKLKLLDDLVEKNNSWRVAAEVVEGIDSAGRGQQVFGKLLVYWTKKENQKPQLGFGDVLLVPCDVMEMPTAAFPEGFDFKAVMRYQNIQHQLFLHGGTWLKTGHSAGVVMSLANQARNRIVSLLNAHLPPRFAALAASLLIGIRNGVEADDLKAFSVTGTMHVLAVSGMHAALLYLALLVLFTGKGRGMRLQRYQGVIVILVLWAFAFITGLSASVIRAVLMCTIAESGRSLLLRQGNSLNTLLVAAFVQLCADPLQLIDVGFQLSYLAVIGILVLYPWFNSLWSPPGKLIAMLWQSALISLAATIATLPVTLYFFGNFPLWFIPANLAIVPLSTLAIVLCLLALLLGWLPLAGAVFYSIASAGLRLLLWVAALFARLPLASVSGLKPDDFQVFALACFIVLMSLFFVYQKKNYAWFAGLFLLLFPLYSILKNSRVNQQRELVLCELRGNAIASVREGRSLTVVSLPMAKGRTDSLFEFMLPYCQKYGIQKVEWTFVGAAMPVLNSCRLESQFPVLKVHPKSPSPAATVKLLFWNHKLEFKADSGEILVVQSRFTKGITPGKVQVLVLKNNFVRMRI